MSKTSRQSIFNARDVPIYISIEPTPECYEIEPGETLTLIYEIPEEGDALTINVIDEGLSIVPPYKEPEVLINGIIASERSWVFKHA
jgi:hypothetical protein